ncbi:hypothetical protein ACMCNP_08400 [Candidatus Acidulodesulfobacterium sp. H_13]|uniref:hypothetical protein n=1 Tax=Candidatus Acidulodesulfobacterium sp. H_13 TaxID=3395470 RepID=UPI003AF6E0FC
MFLNSPHLASGYYGKLFKTIQKEIFEENHEFIPYYTSSYFLYRFERYIRSSEVDRIYNKARYHIMMLYRIIISNEKVVELNNKSIITVCEKIINSFDSFESFKEVFDKVIFLLNKSEIDIDNPKSLYQKSNTEILIDTFNNNKGNL